MRSDPLTEFGSLYGVMIALYDSSDNLSTALPRHKSPKKNIPIDEDGHWQADYGKEDRKNCHSVPRVRAKLEIDRKRIKGASTTHTHKTPPASGTLYAFFGPLVADPPTKTIESTERRVEYIRVGYIPTRIIFS